MHKLLLNTVYAWLVLGGIAAAANYIQLSQSPSALSQLGAGIVQQDSTGATTATNSIAGHLRTAGTAPALTSCGTSPAIVGTDNAGEVTMGTGSPTGCVITFATAYTSAPYCAVSWEATPLASQSYVVASTTITLTQTGTSSNKVAYVCFGRDAG